MLSVGMLDDYQKKAMLAAACMETIFLLLALLNALVGWIMLFIFAGSAAFMTWHLYGDKIMKKVRSK